MEKIIFTVLYCFFAEVLAQQETDNAETLSNLDVGKVLSDGHQKERISELNYKKVCKGSAHFVYFSSSTSASISTFFRFFSVKN
jgi:hypothetical protein